jgi:GTPase SAR1 family protein
MYYRSSKAALCVYDVCKKETFEAVGDWIRAYRDVVGEKSPILLIANKIDCMDREVETKEGKEYAESNGYRFLEVSAKEGTNISLIVSELQEVIGSSRSEKGELETEPAESGCC